MKTPSVSKILDKRQRDVAYNLNSVKGAQAKMYWFGAFDEIKRIRKALKCSSKAV